MYSLARTSPEHQRPQKSNRAMNPESIGQALIDHREATDAQRQLKHDIANSPRVVMQREMRQQMNANARLLPLQKQRQPINPSNSPVTQRVALTRSMWKIINETTINSKEERTSVEGFLKSKGYGYDVIQEILNRVETKTKSNSDDDVFNGYGGEKKDVIDESDEIEMNVVDHGDLNEYDNPSQIDDYLKNDLGIVQMARKGNTISGPKDYSTNNFGDFKQVAYTTDGKGSIDFAKPSQQATWSNPVYGGSLVDLSAAGKTIDKKNRPQHFALGDYLFANKSGKKASYTTDLRKGKWTWHHLPTQYQMVLVDMTVHAKHGHNGGVYLW